MIRFPRLALLLGLLAIPALGQQQPATTSQPPAAAQPAAPATDTPAKQPDKAAAYYHYSMAHVYEEMVTAYGRTELANKAIDEYRLALDNDPGSEYLNTGLAEL